MIRSVLIHLLALVNLGLMLRLALLIGGVQIPETYTPDGFRIVLDQLPAGPDGFFVVSLTLVFIALIVPLLVFVQLALLAYITGRISGMGFDYEFDSILGNETSRQPYRT